MKNGPFEDVFPIENGDILASYVSLPEGNSFFHPSISGIEMIHRYYSVYIMQSTMQEKHILPYI